MTTRRSVSSARDEVRQVAPKLIELSETVLYGDVWERPGLWPAAMTAGRIARRVFDETQP